MVISHTHLTLPYHAGQGAWGNQSLIIYDMLHAQACLTTNLASATDKDNMLDPEGFMSRAVLKRFPNLRELVVEIKFDSARDNEVQAYNKLRAAYPGHWVDDHSVGINRTLTSQDVKGPYICVPGRRKGGVQARHVGLQYPERFCEVWESKVFKRIWRMWYHYGKVYSVSRPDVELSFSFRLARHWSAVRVSDNGQ